MATKFSFNVDGKVMSLSPVDAQAFKAMGMKVELLGAIEKKGTNAAAPKNSYTHFELKGSDWSVESVPSKSGNPDAVLVYKSEKNELRNAILKVFGWKWNQAGLYWYNVNNDEAKKVFSFKAEDIFSK